MKKIRTVLADGIFFMCLLITGFLLLDKTNGGTTKEYWFMCAMMTISNLCGREVGYTREGNG